MNIIEYELLNLLLFLSRFEMVAISFCSYTFKAVSRRPNAILKMTYDHIDLHKSKGVL